MEGKTWTELSQIALNAIEEVKTASEAYDDQMEEIMRPRVIERGVSSETPIDYKSILRYANDLNSGVNEVQQLLVTANTHVIKAVFALIQANMLTLEKPQKLNLILDDNNYLKLANFLEQVKDNRFDVFYKSCSSILSLLKRMLAITKKDTISYPVNMEGLSKLIEILDWHSTPEEPSTEENG